MAIEFLNEVMMEVWESFVHTANDWIVGHAASPHIATVSVFAAGTAAEILLKAVLIKRDGDIKAAMKHGHNLRSLWDSCKSSDPLFMPAFNFIEACYDYHDTNKANRLLGDAEHLKHFILHEQWYLASWSLADWKYLGTIPKNKPSWISHCTSYPNLFWARFFHDLRNYIGFEDGKQNDQITLQLDHHRHMYQKEEIWFLEQVIGRAKCQHSLDTTLLRLPPIVPNLD